MIIEALSQLLSGNIVWFIDIVLNNLHWLFALFAFIVITYTDSGIMKKHFINFIFLVGFLWTFVSLASLTDLLLFSPGIFLIFQLVILIFWPKEVGSKHPSLYLYFVVSIFVIFSMLLTFGYI